MKVKRSIRKIHRWVGLIAALWLFVLASTGFLLQHSHDWHLDKKYINSSLLLKAYGIGNQFIVFQNQQNKIVQLDHQIILNNKASIKLTDILVSAIYNQENWLIATQNKLTWLNTKGQIMQTLDELDGLPTPIQALGLKDNKLYLLSNNKIFDLQNLEELQLSKETIDWAHAQTNKALKTQTIQNNTKNYLSYEQFLFDIHAGITTPSLFNDIAALALIFLSLSGIFLFFRKNKKQTNTTPRNKVK